VIPCCSETATSARACRTPMAEERTAATAPMLCIVDLLQFRTHPHIGSAVGCGQSTPRQVVSPALVDAQGMHRAAVLCSALARTKMDPMRGCSREDDAPALHTYEEWTSWYRKLNFRNYVCVLQLSKLHQTGCYYNHKQRQPAILGCKKRDSRNQKVNLQKWYTMEYENSAIFL
jgi:hypothetical protein